MIEDNGDPLNPASAAYQGTLDGEGDCEHCEGVGFVDDAQTIPCGVCGGSGFLGVYVRVADSLPPDGVVVMTKIDDEAGCRNEQRLKRNGHLWFFEDDSMYVYYVPTHWKAI